MIGADRLLVAGDASARVAEVASQRGVNAVISNAPGVADAAIVAAVAARRHRAGEAGEPAEPLYLRPPDVTMSPNSGRLRP